MYIEIASAIVTLGSAISAFISYKGAKASEARARGQAIDACVYSSSATRASDSAKACADATANDLRIAEGCVASTKGDSSLCMGFMNDTLSAAAKHRQIAEKIKTETEAAREAALNHACTAAKFVEATASHCRVAEQYASRAAGHAEVAGLKAGVASLNATVAEGHASKAASHADSVGALSGSIAHVAAQSGVRLATRTDYTNDGGNIGGR